MTVFSPKYVGMIETLKETFSPFISILNLPSCGNLFSSSFKFDKTLILAVMLVAAVFGKIIASCKMSVDSVTDQEHHFPCIQCEYPKHSAKWRASKEFQRCGRPANLPPFFSKFLQGASSPVKPDIFKARTSFCINSPNSAFKLF